MRIARADADWLSDLMRHTGFTLLAALPTEAMAPKLAEFLDRIGTRYARCLKTRVLPKAPAELAARGVAAQLYLVRPDGYVALRAAENEAARIESWLKSTLL